MRNSRARGKYRASLLCTEERRLQRQISDTLTKTRSEWKKDADPVKEILEWAEKVTVSVRCNIGAVEAALVPILRAINGVREIELASYRRALSVACVSPNPSKVLEEWKNSLPLLGKSTSMIIMDDPLGGDAGGDNGTGQGKVYRRNTKSG